MIKIITPAVKQFSQGTLILRLKTQQHDCSKLSLQRRRNQVLLQSAHADRMPGYDNARYSAI